MSDDADRRGNTREPWTLKVEYQDAKELVADFTENISSGGIFVLTKRPFTVGAPLRLSLSFPGLLEPLPLSGTVQWVRKDEDAEGVGVALDGSSAEEAERLRDLVRRIGEGDPALVARTLRVLVVEDNPHVANLIRDGLQGSVRRELGGRVTFHFATAGNGREALAAMALDPIDVLIIDIYLPVMDGIQVIRHVRCDPRHAQIPILAVSAGGAAAREGAMEAGADFFLDKPMRLTEVLETLRRLAKLG